MRKMENGKSGADRPGAPASLTDEDITTARVDRRSFLWRAVAVSSVAAGAVLTAACPGGTDSDGGGDAGSPATDSDQATDSDRSE